MSEPITINALLQLSGIRGGYAKKTKTKNENA